MKPLLLLLTLLIAGCAGSEQLRTESVDAQESASAKIPSSAVLDHAIAGAVYEAQGEYMLALHEYNRGLLRDSTSTELYHAAAQMHTQLGDLESAILILKQGVRVQPVPSLLSHLGEIQLQQRNFEEAASTFAQLREMDPDDLAAIQNLAMSLERSGQIESALEIYDELLELDVIDEEPILMRKVTLLSSLGRFEEAVEVYKLLQELRPGEDRIPFFIGGLFLDMGDTTRAVENIASATKMRPIEPRYWDMWIRLEVVQGNVDRAIELSDSAMSYNPVDASIHALAASVFIIKGLNEKAESALKRAVQIDPENAEHYLNLGFLYHDMERWSEAGEQYEKAMELAPGDPQVLNNYAYLLAVQGEDLERALELSEDAISIEPDNPSFLDTKGWILFRLERYSEAQTYLERASELDPGHSEILDHLGDLYAVMGMREAALEMWRLALEAGGDKTAISRKMEE